MTAKKVTRSLLKSIVDKAMLCQEGKPANYIPELNNTDAELTALAVWCLDDSPVFYSNKPDLPAITLQSTAKLIPLIGLLEEFGPEQVFDWVAVEPSGDDFASITRLEQFGPKPSNPMLNAGAITLCSKIPGIGEQQFAWLEKWVQKLFGERLSINPLVFASEKRTGDRNRSLAYLLKSRHSICDDVNSVLDLYFTLCSYESNLEKILYLPSLLANGGKDPRNNQAIISRQTVEITLAIMATCGLYDESGTHMVRCGIPAKSGVSGYMIASVAGKAGIAALSPKVNPKGNSIRGKIMLEDIAQQLGWHFANTEH
ncbi:MAG: glutaminase A [Legionellaceae bacterium]|nr:glutaminase A [Legionellaceae bacterium]